MESRLRIAGQTVQPVLVMFPLALFALAVVFDVGQQCGGPVFLAALAYWNIVGGLISGIIAALASGIDLAMLRDGTAAKRTGLLLELINMGVLVVFAVVLMVRMRTPERVAGGGVLAIEIGVLVAAVGGAWVG